MLRSWINRTVCLPAVCVTDICTTPRSEADDSCKSYCFWGDEHCLWKRQPVNFLGDGPRSFLSLPRPRWGHQCCPKRHSCASSFLGTGPPHFFSFLICFSSETLNLSVAFRLWICIWSLGVWMSHLPIRLAFLFSAWWVLPRIGIAAVGYRFLGIEFLLVAVTSIIAKLALVFLGGAVWKNTCGLVTLSFIKCSVPASELRVKNTVMKFHEIWRRGGFS